MRLKLTRNTAFVLFVGLLMLIVLEVSLFAFQGH
jgi:hypothetical protein